MRGRRERHTEESLARLRDRLHAEADRHRPDTARIWARVEAAMNEQTAAPDPIPAWEPRPWRRRGDLRAAAAALATAAVMGVTSLAVVVLNGDAGPGPVVPPPPRTGAPLPSSTATVSPSPSEDGEADSDTVGGVRPPARNEPGPGEGGQGGAPVSVTAAQDGALPYWGRNTLTLTVHRPLTALNVTIRVARSRRTFPAGSWNSMPGSHVRSDTDLTDDAIVHRLTLLPGRTLPSGRYLVAVQYQPGGPHDPARDTFAVTAHAAGGSASPTIRGHF
ncbi:MULTISPECIES: hypothetical protein [Thermomonospora]|uniref:Uncharacterized protein n=1 Tax=Thermomonospora cellulosilytica TaxID=1411118 RepID=A0A7W3R8Q5_9ACTN|nr:MULTISPECIES: hypothetical protein [Thermomonospora]MBA9004573.1 hypothetical protein [Thermomonospora cellulosilytica]